MIDQDTVVSEGSWSAALHAAGGAAAMVDALLGGEARIGASLHRPPGHHAESGRAMGFCLFDNVAVAARHARDAHGVGRVLILDWDVHHGNGTQQIFWRTDEVLFCSIHEWPLYPGPGAAGEIGAGAGEGITLNLPVPAGTGDAGFTSLVQHVVVPAARAYAPGLVLVSAGYDAHGDDPLAGCRVTDSGFATMATSARALADELDVPLGIVLEGGYELGALARGFACTLEVVGTDGPVGAPDVDEHSLATAALERLRQASPLLG
jgi:acetoin utilization deacetylase AcuC-like enzyme